CTETSVSEPLMTCRNLSSDDVKTGSGHTLGISLAVTHVLAKRRPVVRRRERASGFHGRNRRWEHEHPGQRDDAWFKREIAPKLDAFTLAEIAAVTGLSPAACSGICAGAKVPHPRHREALRKLADS
ncbi:MAG: hypothetical protein WCC84_01205, partial [Candidatus Cybelea sp.]